MKEKADYLKYRIEKSKIILEDAKLLASNKRWISAMNRLYYASFYAVQALLYSNEIIAKTHNGNRTKFLQEFIKTGIISKEFGDLYVDLFAWRQELDYNDFSETSEEKVLPFIDKVAEFIELIDELLKKFSK